MTLTHTFLEEKKDDLRGLKLLKLPNNNITMNDSKTFVGFLKLILVNQEVDFSNNSLFKNFLFPTFENIDQAINEYRKQPL